MEKLRYDLFYIKHYSVRMDLRILLETVRIVLLGSGFVNCSHRKHSASPSEERA
jgi:lipopolysaccharide/colanic/teichoic acid biosynthesis glycosyltransferase